MSSYKFDLSISSSSTEVAFVKAIISAITGLDDRITCMDDPDVEYAEGGTYKPTFRFCLNNVEFFRFQRSAQKSSRNNAFAFSYTIDDVPTSLKVVNYASDTSDWSANASRTYKLSYILNGDFIALCIAKPYVSGTNRDHVVFSSILTSDDSYVSSYTDPYDRNYNVGTVFDLSNRVFNSISGGAISDMTFLSRFTYKAQPGKVDYIKNSIYTSSGSKIFDTTTLYDCSEVTSGSTVSTNDGAYLAVGPHQLVKVS